MTRLMILPGLLIAASGLLLAACGDTGTQPTPDAAVPAPDAAAADAGNALVPGTYAFESRFVPGESSVSYSGQTFRQVLIAEMTAYVEGLTERIDTGAFLPGAGEVSAALGFYYEFDDSTSADVLLTITTEPALLQMRYADISSGKDLKGKLAGNDPVGQHKDWSTEFRGWSEGEVSSPDALVQYWMGRLDELAVARASGSIGTDPTGQPITNVYITESGQDLKQLMQKFLLGAVTVSQAMDDYLDDATPGAGLHSSNARDGDAPYSVLEHGWDEGFGYFGAARDYNDYTDDEIAGAGGRPEYVGSYHDSSGDGAVDLLAEYNFGNSTNAGKRDRGSAESAPTDFSKAIFDGFLAGRAIISAAGDELGDEQMSALIAQRDIIIEGWDKVIAATVIHYINAVLQDMSTFATPDYSFADHAKHWSELKGFALGMQFNPYSKLDDAQFVALHTGLGDAPVLPGAAAAEIEVYRQGLLGARDVIARAYGFDPANVGDESGMGGW